MSGKYKFNLEVNLEQISERYGIKASFPYDSKLNKNKVEFNLVNMPKELRQLLYKFACLHSKKMEEDKLTETFSGLSIEEKDREDDNGKKRKNKK